MTCYNKSTKSNLLDLFNKLTICFTEMILYVQILVEIFKGSKEDQNPVVKYNFSNKNTEVIN